MGRILNRGDADDSLTAAAAVELRIANAGDAIYINETRRRETMSAWDYYRLAEVRYPAAYIGEQLSQMVVFPATRDGAVYTGIERDSEIGGVAHRVLDSLQGPLGGPSEMLRKWGECSLITGEVFLVGLKARDGQPEEWMLLSDREVRVIADAGSTQRPTWEIEHPTSTEWRTIQDGDMITRFWRPHPMRARLADSALLSMLTEAEELDLLISGIRARLVTRLLTAGVFFIPNSLSTPDNLAPPDGSGGGIEDSTTDRIYRSMLQTLTNRGADTAAIPIVLSGPDEAGAAIRHITLNTEISEQEARQRDELRLSLARGFDLPVETQQEMREANHWSSWTVHNSSIDSFLVPKAMGLLRPLTQRWYRKRLIQAGLTAEQANAIHLAADPSPLRLQHNRVEQANQLYDRAAISDEYLREVSDVPSDAVMGEAEMVRWIGRHIQNPYLATWGLEIHDQIDWDKVAVTGSKRGVKGVETPEAKVGPGDEPGPAPRGQASGNGVRIGDLRIRTDV